MQISPPGYPSVGEQWTINVYIADVASSTKKLTFRPALNSTVVITLLLDGDLRTYELPVEENGKALFQFLPGYSDIAFQANCPGLSSSEKLVLSEHYVPPFVAPVLVLILVVAAGAVAVVLAVAKWKRKPINVVGAS
jgi:hypothetical protein